MNLDDLRQIAENAHDHIGDICTGKSRWTMTVPAREDDSDILFSKLADGIEELLDRVEKAERELESRTRRLEHAENEYNRLETSHSILEQKIQRVRDRHKPDTSNYSLDLPGEGPQCTCGYFGEYWECPELKALEGKE